MSTSRGQWTVRAECPHGEVAELVFDDLGYLMRPHPDACEKHLNPPAKTAHGVELPPPLKLSERQIRREARKAARAAARKGWRPPWLLS